MAAYVGCDTERYRCRDTDTTTDISSPAGKQLMNLALAFAPPGYNARCYEHDVVSEAKMVKLPAVVLHSNVFPFRSRIAFPSVALKSIRGMVSAFRTPLFTSMTTSL
ncbi:unnamed protein product [Heligmosomoides polygyrus]|uniref:Glycosyltransferase n=1 Tax=Heligmosomoides polygyrus TaxID=6339 RepID=A0A183G5A6_HELPZ|nr:unnamed protein product [Heligmosomoides polygyrus]